MRRKTRTAAHRRAPARKTGVSWQNGTAREGSDTSFMSTAFESKGRSGTWVIHGVPFRFFALTVPAGGVTSKTSRTGALFNGRRPGFGDTGPSRGRCRPAAHALFGDRYLPGANAVSSADTVVRSEEALGRVINVLATMAIQVRTKAPKIRWMRPTAGRPA